MTILIAKIEQNNDYIYSRIEENNDYIYSKIEQNDYINRKIRA